MRIVFADANYWIALLNPRDRLHKRANAVSADLGECRIVTSEMVLVELLNGLGDKGAVLREKAVQCVKRLSVDPNVDVVLQTNRQFRDALERYSSRKDKEWGLTDCASFLIMEAKDLSDALTNDRHFDQAGFVPLMREKTD